MSVPRLPTLLVAVGLAAVATSANAQLADMLKNAAKKQLGGASPASQGSQGSSNFMTSGPDEPLLNGRTPPGLGEMVVSKKRPTSFADAKANAVTEVSDGDDVWVALRTNQPLKTYGEAKFHAGQVEHYEIQLQVTPDKGGRAYADCDWLLTPAEAERNEFILGLTPVQARSVPVNGGRFTQEYKSLCWLRTVADDASRPGRWTNRIGLVSAHESNARQNQFVVSAPLTANVPNGFPKWYAIERRTGACDARAQAKGSAVLTCPK